MKTKEEIEAKLAGIQQGYAHVLTGSRATIQINAPRALMQIEAETKLTLLCWMLGGKPYKSKLKGTDL